MSDELTDYDDYNEYDEEDYDYDYDDPFNEFDSEYYDSAEYHDQEMRNDIIIDEYEDYN